MTQTKEPPVNPARFIRPVRGFKTLKTAYATIKGLEVMRALRKGQARMFAIQGGIAGEARIVERAFGVGTVRSDRGHDIATRPSGQRGNISRARFPAWSTSPLRQVCNRAVSAMVAER